MADVFIPDARFAQVCRAIIAHAQDRLADGDLFESNVDPTQRRAQTFTRLLLEYQRSGRITLDDRAIMVIRETYRMSEHNLQIVQGEVLAMRLGWDTSGIELLHITQVVLKPILDHIARGPSSNQHAPPT